MSGDVGSGLSGTFLKENVAWLKSHAVLDVHGALRCRTTHARISAKMVHRYRARGASDQVFFPEGNPALIGFQNQEMVSFRVLWCPNCEPRREDPVCVRPDALVSFVP